MPAYPTAKDDLRRVVVIGPSGSGKSSFAKALAELRSCPYIEMDSLHHLPDWKERSPMEMEALLTEKIKTDNWVIDGNYRRYRPLTWQRATAVVWLNHPYFTVLKRGYSRTLRRVFTGEELWGTGNKETLRQTFLSKDSMLHWIAVTYHRRQRICREWMNDPAYIHLAKFTLRGQSQVNMFFDSLKTAKFA